MSSFYYKVDRGGNLSRNRLDELVAASSLFWAASNTDTVENRSSVTVDKGQEEEVAVAVPVPKDARKAKQTKFNMGPKPQLKSKRAKKAVVGTKPQTKSKRAIKAVVKTKLESSQPPRPQPDSSTAPKTTSLAGTFAIAKSSHLKPLGSCSRVDQQKLSQWCTLTGMGPRAFSPPSLYPSQTTQTTSSFGVNPFNPPWCPGLKNVRDDDVPRILTEYSNTQLVLMSWTPNRQMTVDENDFFVRSFVDSTWGADGNIIFFCAGCEVVRCHSVILHGILPHFTNELFGMTKFPYNAYVSELPYIPIFVGGVESKIIQKLLNLIYRGSDSFVGHEVQKLMEVIDLLNILELTICIVPPPDQLDDQGRWNIKSSMDMSSSTGTTQGHSGPWEAQRASVDFDNDEEFDRHDEAAGPVTSSGKTKRSKTTTLRLRSDGNSVSTEGCLHVAGGGASGNA